MKKITGSLAIVALALIFAVPAAAVDWNFYGSARMQTGWVYSDNGDTKTVEDDFDATWRLQANARIGAIVKHDALAGRFEYGSGPNLRLLFGTYTTGDLEFKIGQDYTPTGSFFYSNQVWGQDNDLLDCGQFYGGRHAMLQVKMGGLKLALVSPVTDRLPTGAPAVDVDVIIPKIEASYGLKVDPIFMDFFAGFQTYKLDFETRTNQDSDSVNVNSGVGGMGIGFNAGAATIKTGAYVALNARQYGYTSRGNNSALYVERTATQSRKVEKNISFGGLVVFTLKASDAITLETGVGYDSHKLDVDNMERDATMTAYLNATITFMRNFFVVPEIGYVDKFDNQAGVDEGHEIYFGAKWQINF